MKYIIAVLFSALLLWITPTPINNSHSELRKSPKTVTAVAPSTTTPASAKTEQQQPDVKSETQPQPTPQPENQPVATAVATPTTAEQEAKAFIYFKESNNNPHATNSIGCYGIGQDCNGIVKDKCGANYECQDSFFTDYMLRRYGTWLAAKSFWLGNCGSSHGCWW